MKRKSQYYKILIFIFMFLGWTFIFQNEAYASTSNITPVLRLSGVDRYQTAAAISMEGWKTSDYVLIATGEGDDKFADALAGSPLSYSLTAPTLLTPLDELDISTQSEITRLNAKRAVLLGGPGVISYNVENRLKEMGLSVERIWGPDRYCTAVNIGDKMYGINPFSKVFLTTGEEFQYAMMIAPYASRNNIPILFTEKDSLNAISEAALKRWGVCETDIIGNLNIVSQSVEDSLVSMGIKVNRLQGIDLDSTNISIINAYKMDMDCIALARNDLFADGLAGAAFAAAKNIPILLTGKDSAGPLVTDFLAGCNLKYSYILGGSGAVRDYIITLIRKGNPDSISGNTCGNIKNGGLAAEYDGWIYYCSTSDGCKLYKVRSDGTKKEKLCDDRVMYINAIGGWVFYSNLDDSSKIYKIKIDGSCKHKINDDSSWELNVIDNWIYYINRSKNGDLYKIAADGSLKSELNDYKSRYPFIKWDWTYYINEDSSGSICRIKSDFTSDIQRLCGIYAYDMCVSEGWIYFSSRSDNGRLFKISAEGTGLQMLCSDSVFDIQVNEDWIYYTNADDDSRIYKIRTDGTERTLVYNGSAYLLNLVDNWIYFIMDQDGSCLYKVRLDGTGLTGVD